MAHTCRLGSSVLGVSPTLATSQPDVPRPESEADQGLLTRLKPGTPMSPTLGQASYSTMQRHNPVAESLVGSEQMSRQRTCVGLAQKGCACLGLHEAIAASPGISAAG